MKSFFRFIAFTLIISAGIAGWFYYKQGFGQNFNLSFSSLTTTLVPPEVIDSSESVKKAVDKFISKSVCDRTLYYSFGEIDPRHDIDKKELLTIIKKAEEVWEKPTGYNLFEYKEGADFKINFIFDERQQQTNEAKALDNKLQKFNIDQKNFSEKQKQLLEEYKKLEKKYKKSLKELEEETEEYNKEVAYWNAKGGAPKEEYEKLKEKQEDLEELAKKVEKRRKKVNAVVAEINSLSSQENILVKKYNQEIESYRKKYGESREFNQGEYFGEGINIYQFRDEYDLTLALAHELGHTLGIGHVDNPQSVMYYLMGEQDLKNPHLTKEDLDALKNVCAGIVD